MQFVAAGASGRRTAAQSVHGEARGEGGSWVAVGGSWAVMALPHGVNAQDIENIHGLGNAKENKSGRRLRWAASTPHQQLWPATAFW